MDTNFNNLNLEERAKVLLKDYKKGEKVDFAVYDGKLVRETIDYLEEKGLLTV